MSKISEILKKTKEKNIKDVMHEIKWISTIAKRYKGLLFICIIMQILGVVFGTLFGLKVEPLINSFITQEVSQFTRFAIICISIGIINILLSIINQRLSCYLFYKIRKEFSMEVFDVLLKSKWESMVGYHSGDIITRINDDLNVIVDSIAHWLPGLILQGIQLIVSVIIIATFDPSLLVLLVAVSPIIVLGSKIFLGKLYKVNQKIRVFHSHLLSFHKETFHNMQTIKAFGLDKLFHQKRFVLEEENYDLGLELNKFSIASWGTTYFFTQLAAAICFCWTGYRVLSGVISIGALATLYIFATKVSGSAKSILGFIPGALSAATSAKRVREMLMLPEEEVIENEEYYDKMLNVAEKQGASVEIDNVDFSYTNGTEVFDDVSISAKPGEIVALVGPSGEGKTTMLRLILGLITQQKGETKICVGDNEMAMNAATRRFISYVPQGNTIMHGTIADNLRMTCPDATEEAIINALKGACAYEFVSALPDGIYHDIGESGIGFSEGQNQRLAIARALMNPSPILLLDEATSALDVATERKVLNNLMNHENIRTCILTTHRPTVLTMCDKVYRIAAKKVRKIGDEEIEMLMNDF